MQGLCSRFSFGRHVRAHQAALIREGIGLKPQDHRKLQDLTCHIQRFQAGPHWLGLGLDVVLDILDQGNATPSVSDFVCILQNCRKRKDLSKAKRVHAHIRNIGLEDHQTVGNHIVPMFVDCGSLSDAQHVFDKLNCPNVHCWTSLILGCIQSGESKAGFLLYQKMQEKKVDPSSCTFLALLKACVRVTDVREIYSEVVQKSFDNDVFVGSSLVDTYVKCGSLLEAHDVFHKLPVKNVVSWNALMSGYVEEGCAQEVLDYFERMQQEKVCPDVVSFVCILKACGSITATEKGQEAHAWIVHHGYDDLSLGNTLVDMYAKCGLIFEARTVFDKLPIRSVVSWNALIGGYAEHGPSQEAISCFNQMHSDGISQASVTFICALKACGNMAAINEGRGMHLKLTVGGFDMDLFVGSALIDMYVRCRSLMEAHYIFDNLSIQSTVLWNTIISGYAEHGPDQEALNCFDKMQVQRVSPNEITVACTLKACASIGALSKGHELHKEAALRGFERDPFIGSSLLDMYVKCGALLDGKEVSNKLLASSVVSLTALLAGYVEHGRGQEALDFFELVEAQGVSPNAPMLATVLKACTDVTCIDMGRKMHGRLTAKGLERDPIVDITLVEMYVKCGSLTEAEEVFFKWPVHDVVSWNVLIGCYSDKEETSGKAFDCFKKMQLQGTPPNDATYACILKVCGSIALPNKGQKVHMEVALRGFQTALFVGSSLVDMYAKCGLLAEAQYAFDKLSARSIVSWTALTTGYSEHGSGHEVLSCFEQLQLHDFSPNAAIFASVMKACGSVGSLDLGRIIHREITVKGAEQDLFVGNTLIDMYAKYGCLAEAQDAFGRLPAPDVVSWNAIIKGYGMNHNGERAMQLFEEMQAHRMKPNGVTFTCILNACSHASLVTRGQDVFKAMEEDYGVIPSAEHYECMIDLFARSGHLYEAASFLDIMPCSASQDTLMLLLSACKTHVEPELGFRCFQQLIQSNEKLAAPYVLMANLYGSLGRWDEAHRIEELRKSSEAVKKSASASIELNNKPHEFIVGADRVNEELVETLRTLALRIEEMGHVPGLDLVLKPRSMGEDGLCG